MGVSKRRRGEKGSSLVGKVKSISSLVAKERQNYGFRSMDGVLVSALCTSVPNGSQLERYKIPSLKVLLQIKTSDNKLSAL